jgi:hypothetical protein
VQKVRGGMGRNEMIGHYIVDGQLFLQIEDIKAFPVFVQLYLQLITKLVLYKAIRLMGGFLFDIKYEL